MKKFQFSLAKVLVQREIEQDIAQKYFAEAEAQLRAEKEKLNEMIDTKNRTLEERAAIVQQSQDWSNSVDQMNTFLAGQDLRINNQHLRLLEAEKLVELRREILRQKVSEVKIIERLKEKQKQRYMSEVAKQEQAEMDELSVLRFSRNENPIKGSHEDGI